MVLTWTRCSIMTLHEVADSKVIAGYTATVEAYPLHWCFTITSYRRRFEFQN